MRLACRQLTCSLKCRWLHNVKLLPCVCQVVVDAADSDALTVRSRRERVPYDIVSGRLASAAGDESLGVVLSELMI